MNWAGRHVWETFDQHVRLNPATGCVEWLRAIHTGGYGQLIVRGKIAYAHRFAWQRANGPIPAGLHVLHSCDNRKCVNVGHLRLGTNEDNHREKVAKGRQRGGGGRKPEKKKRIPAHRNFEGQIIQHPETGCWLWSRNVSSAGYGLITIGGKKQLAHRHSVERTTGRPIPAGLVVRHACDVRTCVNPDHLIVGTQSDNVKDQYLRGRR